MVAVYIFLAVLRRPRRPPLASRPPPRYPVRGRHRPGRPLRSDAPGDRRLGRSHLLQDRLRPRAGAPLPQGALPLGVEPAGDGGPRAIPARREPPAEDRRGPRPGGVGASRRRRDRSRPRPRGDRSGGAAARLCGPADRRAEQHEPARDREPGLPGGPPRRGAADPRSARRRGRRPRLDRCWANGGTSGATSSRTWSCIGGVAEEAAIALERIRLVQQVAEEAIARQRLDEIDRLKSDFLSGVSHDLRTPITSIAWSIQNLLDGVVGPLSDRQREYLDAVRTSSRPARPAREQPGRDQPARALAGADRDRAGRSRGRPGGDDRGL